MGTYIWCEIVCATCSGSTAGEYTTAGLRRRAMKKEAKKNGFIFVGNEAFCSSRCVEQWNEMLEQEPSHNGQ